MHGTHELIDEFFEIFNESKPDQYELIDRLASAIDALTLAALRTTYAFDEAEYDEPPSPDYREIRALVEKVFPDFGFYNSVENVSESVGATITTVGDAVDDLADILGDMHEIRWRFENTSVDDALFHFQLGYRSHWGRHARDLQLYIHDYY